MHRIALATAIVALATGPLAVNGVAALSRATYLAPGAIPPWENATTTTETPPAPASTVTPAAAAAAPAPIAPAPTAPAATAMSAALSPAQPPQGAEAGAATPTPAATAAIPGAAIPMQGMTTPRQAVSLRSGPNTSFPVIGTLHPGMPLHVLATANYGWMQVETAAGTGWAYGSYLAPSSMAQSESRSP